MNIFTLTAEVITANEIGDQPHLLYQFSDADGVRSGKSGYSFGSCQFDIENNWLGILCLKACGFRPKDLKRLFLQNDNIDDLNRKLEQRSSVVDQFDAEQVRTAVVYCTGLIDRTGVKLKNTEALLNVIDYHNQLHLSKGGKLHQWMLQYPHLISAADIRDFKQVHTLWGRKRPDDVERRYQNIQRIYGQHG